MSHNPSAGRKSRRISRWVWSGIGASILYGIFIIFMLRSDHVDWSASLVPNAWGDLLAGAFAPLAFLWLFIAVMVQANELSLQREELVLTRGEYEQNRAVSEAQLTEIRRQAEHILAQTEVMRSEWDQRQSEIAEAAYERMLDSLHDFILGNSSVYTAKLSDGHVYGLMGGTNTDRDRNIQAHRRSLVQWLYHLKGKVENENLQLVHVPETLKIAIDHQVEILSSLLDVSAKASPQVQLDCRLRGILHMKRLLSAVVSFVGYPDQESTPGIGVDRDDVSNGAT